MQSAELLRNTVARAKEADDLEKDLRSAERLLRIAKEANVSLREANNNLHQGINRIGDEVRELRSAVANEVAKREAFKGEIVTAGNHAACRLNVLGDIHRILGSDGEPTGANVLTGVSPELARLPKRIERLLQDTTTWRERYDKEVFKNGELARLMEDTRQVTDFTGPQSLRDRIRHAINCTSAENESDTPDFILTDYLMASLDAFDAATRCREKWYGREPKVVDSLVAAALGPVTMTYDPKAMVTYSVEGQAWCRTDEEYPNCLELVTYRNAKPLRVVLCDIVRRTTMSSSSIEYVPIQVDDLPQVTEAAAS